MPSPGLTRTDPASPTRGIVLMLHGGAKTGRQAGRPAQRLAAAYDGRCATCSSRGSSSEGLSLWLLRFGVRGWNAGAGRRALARARRPLGARPGRRGAPRRAGRAARPLDGRAYGGPRRRPPQRRRASSALAPWLEPTDPVRTLAGRHLVAGHGSRDKITSARMTRAYVDRARAVAASAEFVDMGRLGHYMLARPEALEPVRRWPTLEVLDRARPVRRTRATASRRPTPTEPPECRARRRWLSQRNDFPPASRRTRASAACRLSSIGLLFGLTGLGSSSAAIALPVIGADLGVSTGVGAWAISLYALMLAVATAVYGRVSDLVGHPPAAGGRRQPDDRRRAGRGAGPQLRRAARRPDHPGRRGGRRTDPGRRDRQPPGSPAPPRASPWGGSPALAAAVSCLGPLAGGVVEGLLGWRAVIALPMLGILLLPAAVALGARPRAAAPGSTCSAPRLVAATAAGVVLLVQSPSTGPIVAVVGAVLAVLGVPAVPLWVRRRPNGFLPLDVIRNPAVVRSALAAGAVPAAWFALLIAVPAVLVGHGLGALAGGRGPDAQRRDRADSRRGSPARCSTGSARPGRSALAALISAVALGVASLGRARGVGHLAGGGRGRRHLGLRRWASRP